MSINDQIPPNPHPVKPPPNLPPPKQVSQPKRYNHRKDFNGMMVDKNGVWVKLSAVRDIAAENERLRKAGDDLAWAFAFAVSSQDGKESGLITAWRAAKEGRDAK